MFYKKFLRRIRRGFGPVSTSKPSLLAKTTYNPKGPSFYLPNLIGPSTVLPYVVGAQAVRNVIAVLERLSRDEYLDFVLDFLRTGLERFGESWYYADINTVLLGLAQVLQPQSYMEIGVRRGRSMAMVASQCKDCSIAGFDLWAENYGGMENPGKDFVREELRRIGFSGDLHFVDGDSKVTVPQYFQKYPERYFDMITVDGDHTLDGARQDLLNVIPRISIGGVLIFDDISNQDCLYLESLWNDLVAHNPQFTAFSFTEIGFGIAFAIRKF